MLSMERKNRTSMDVIRKGDELELDIEKLAYGGKAVSRVEGLVVFTDHGVPGQRIRARITRKKRQYAEARALEVLSESPSYTAPFCPHFGVCGGCAWQDLAYGDQLKWKRVHVLECLEHLAGVGEALVEPLVPSPSETYYRNKMEFTFSDRRWLSTEEINSRGMQDADRFTLGLHVRGFFDKIFDVETCFLESVQAVDILRATREWCAASGIPAYGIKTQQGFWRFLVVREGKRTDQALIHIVTTNRPEYQQYVDDLAEHLLSRIPNVTTIIHSISDKKAQVATGDATRVVFGPGYIEERLGELIFRISAHSFFQTNPRSAEMLYETVCRLSGFEGGETVWDLYCGTGSITLFIASRVRRVVGFEVVAEAIEDAYVNARLNGIGNCSFVAGDLKDMIRDARRPGGDADLPDTVITDPPRAGMHPHVVKALLEIAPRRIIYVSCNPATLARDLAELLVDYEVRKVQPFDLFPHTPHIECVVRLDKRMDS